MYRPKGTGSIASFLKHTHYFLRRQFDAAVERPLLRKRIISWMKVGEIICWMNPRPGHIANYTDFFFHMDRMRPLLARN